MTLSPCNAIAAATLLFITAATAALNLANASPATCTDCIETDANTAQMAHARSPRSTMPEPSAPSDHAAVPMRELDPNGGATGADPDPEMFDSQALESWWQSYQAKWGGTASGSR
jgi:hypothetical protein